MKCVEHDLPHGSDRRIQGKQGLQEVRAQGRRDRLDEPEHQLRRSHETPREERRIQILDAAVVGTFVGP